MDKFLNKYDKRKKHLLYFLDSEDRIFTLKEIMEHLQVSEKTARLQMMMLKEELEQVTNQLKVVIEKKGWKLERNNNFPVQLILTQWIIKSIPFKYVTALFYEEAVTMKSFALKYHISQSLFYKEIKGIRKWFELFDIRIHELSKYPNQVNEMRIRYVFFKFYWMVYKGDIAFLNQDEILEIKKFIQKIEGLMGGNVNAIQKDKLAFWVAISTIRNKNKKFIESDIDCSYDSEIKKKIADEYSFFLLGKNLSVAEMKTEINFLFILLTIYPLDKYKKKNQLEFKEIVSPTLQYLNAEILLVLGDYIQVNRKKIKESSYLINQMNEICLKVKYFQSNKISQNGHISKIKSSLLRKVFNQIFLEIIKKNEKYDVKYIEKNVEFLSNAYADIFEDYIYWDYYITKVKIQFIFDSLKEKEDFIKLNFTPYILDKVRILSLNSQDQPNLTISNYSYSKWTTNKFYFTNHELKKKEYEDLKQLIDLLFNQLNKN